MNEFIAYIVGLVTGAAVVAAYVAIYRRAADRMKAATWERLAMEAAQQSEHDLAVAGMPNEPGQDVQSFDHETAHADDYKPREFRSWL